MEYIILHRSALVSLWPLVARPRATLRSTQSMGSYAAPRATYGSVFDLAAAWPLPPEAHDAVVASRVFQVTSTSAACVISDGLVARFGDIQQQAVVSFTNRITHEQARWCCRSVEKCHMRNLG